MKIEPWSIWSAYSEYEDKPGEGDIRPHIIVMVEENHVTAFRVTSKQWHGNDPNYYRIRNRNGTGLTKESLICCSKVKIYLNDIREMEGNLPNDEIINFQLYLNRLQSGIFQHD